MPCCELHLVYSAVFHSMDSSELHIKDLKTSLNNNAIGASAEFFKFPGEGEAKL